MVLPSIADALIVIVLLIPGFIAFWMTKRIGKFNRPLSEFETSVWSFTFSAIIIFFFTLSTGLTDLDLIRKEFFYPTNFFALFVITGVVGLAGGGILYLSDRNRTIEESQRYALKISKKVSDRITKREKELKRLYDNQIISKWEYDTEQEKLNPERQKTILTVFTKDNLQFSGYLLHSTDDSWDILIGKAYEDEKWEKLLIKGEDITRVFFFSDSS